MEAVHAGDGDEDLGLLARVAPDLPRNIAEFACGRIHSRAGLGRRQRQLLTIACLSVLGDCEPQLTVYVGSAAHVGLAPREVVEAMLHCVPYVGFPRVMNALAVAARVFAERGLVWARKGQLISGRPGPKDQGE